MISNDLECLYKTIENIYKITQKFHKCVEKISRRILNKLGFLINLINILCRYAIIFFSNLG